MSFAKKIQSLDRRWVYLIIALAIIVPLLIPFNSRTYVTEPSENIYKMIDSFSGNPNKAILICFSHDASTMAELFPMEVSILRQCFLRNIKVFTICFSPTSAPLMDYAINTAKKPYPNIKSGINYVNFGYKPASIQIPIILDMGEDIAKAIKTDSEGRKVANLPIMKGIKNYNDMNLVIDVSASGSVYYWITYARAKFGANVAAGITAVMAADNYPYLQSGQLIGMLSGLKGAAEYEKMVDVFAVHNRPFSKEIIKSTWVKITNKKIPYNFKLARIGMNAQSVAHLVIILFIIIGNLGFFLSKKEEKK